MKCHLEIVSWKVALHARVAEPVHDGYCALGAYLIRAHVESEGIRPANIMMRSSTDAGTININGQDTAVCAQR